MTNWKIHINAVNRLLLQTVWPFVLIVIILLSTTLASLEIMSSVRAYVGAESLYSKSQKQAYFALVNYLRTESKSDYDEFMEQISVPLGDTKARIALEAESPDLDAAYEGFIQGRNLPSDAEKMVFLFHHFAETPIMRKPVQIWTAADYYILKTLKLGKEIHSKMQNGKLLPDEKQHYLRLLHEINLAITPLQELFSSTLAKITSLLETFLTILLISLTTILVALGLIFAKKLVKQRVASTRALQSEARKNLALLRNASDGVHIINTDMKLVEASDSFCKMLGYSREEALGLSIQDWDNKYEPKEISRLFSMYRSMKSRIEFETTHRTKSGESIDVEVSAYPMTIEGEVFLFCSSRDISERKISEKQVQYLAYHDHLTGLPNRARFQDLLSNAISNAQQNHEYGAVLFVDIDNFKNINDVYGHKIGDELLQRVAQQLAANLTQNETVSRIGGDEFVILIPKLFTDYEKSKNRTLEKGENIRAALENPININQRDYFITVSVGISFFPKENIGEEEILQEADIAMYRAKQSGRNALILFKPDMKTSIQERFVLEKYLRNALGKNEIEIHIQSQVDQSGEVKAGECLIRWRHPDKGMISPLDFIPIAESTGQIIPIGEWVLREACKMIAELHRQNRPLRLAVNVSPKQFQQENFAILVYDILQETQAPAKYLTIEITENLLLNNTEEVVDTMLSLSVLGVHFSIDDFGTGYSSLSYLKRLPLKELKIDKSFIQYLPQDENDQALIQTILSVAHHLRLTVVAEGVETIEQHNLLMDLGCNLSQGFYFSRPIQAKEWMHKQLNQN